MNAAWRRRPLWCLSAPPFPRRRGHNKASHGISCVSCSTLRTGCSAPACGGSPAKRARGATVGGQSCKGSTEECPLWCLHGHALVGVRVQKVQRVQRFDTAFGREGCGGRLRRQYKSCLEKHPLWCLRHHLPPSFAGGTMGAQYGTTISSRKKTAHHCADFSCFVSFIPAAGFSYYPVPGW